MKVRRWALPMGPEDLSYWPVDRPALVDHRAPAAPLDRVDGPQPGSTDAVSGRRAHGRSVAGSVSKPRRMRVSRRRAPGRAAGRGSAPRSPAARPRPPSARAARRGSGGARPRTAMWSRALARPDVEAQRVGEDLGVAVGAAEDRGHHRPGAAPAGRRPRCRAAPSARSAAPAGRAAATPPRRWSTAPGRRRRGRARRGGRASSAMPLPSRLTVVSKPAASTSPAVALSSDSLSPSPSSVTVTSWLSRLSPGSRRRLSRWVPSQASNWASARDTER